MKNNNQRNTASTFLMLAVLLLLSACDGGIFGTGSGTNDMLQTTEGSVGVAPNLSESDDNADSEGASTDGTDTSGTQTDGSSVSESTAGDTSVGNTDGATSGGTSGDTSGGTTGVSDGGTTGAGQNPADTTNVQFTNDSAVLDTPQARIKVINASNLTINVFETSVVPNTVLFDQNGLAPMTQSASVALSENQSTLDIVNNNNLGELLGSFSQFNVADATLSSVFVRQLDEIFYLDAAATQITTTDPDLASVRIVQGDDLANAATSAQFSLLASGSNPGGVDVDFSSVSFFTPPSAYMDIPAGDYELVDELGRKDPESFSFAGGTVYTITILGTGATPSLLSDDSAAGN